MQNGFLTKVMVLNIAKIPKENTQQIQSTYSNSKALFSLKQNFL